MNNINNIVSKIVDECKDASTYTKRKLINILALMQEALENDTPKCERDIPSIGKVRANGDKCVPITDEEVEEHEEDVKTLKAQSIKTESFARTTLSGRPPETYDGPAPAPIEPETGMYQDYWVLPKEERDKGFVRPVRTSYVHEKCGSKTTMNIAIAETYARTPSYYGRTFCCQCGGHYPVGVDGEFIWIDGSKVGS